MPKRKKCTSNRLILLLASLLLLMPVLLASDLREIELPGPPVAGPGRIPHHHGSLTLEEITGLAVRNPFGFATLRLRDWIETRQGALVLPPYGLPVGSRGTILVPPAELLLARWAKSLPEGFLTHSLQNLEPIPIDGVHPFLWQPGREADARRALAAAIERGDRSTASILLRRDNLKDAENVEILEWIHGHVPLAANWQRTDGPITVDAKAPQIHQLKGFLPMAHLATAPDGGSFSARHGLNTRRQPIADFHPLKRDQTILFGSGNQVIAIDLSDSLDVIWSWSRHPSSKPERFPSLLGIPEVPVSSGDRCVFLLRTPRYFQRPATNILMEEGHWKGAGWLEAVVLEIPDPHRSPVSAWAAPIALEGFTVAPTPHIDGDRLWLVATRGWSEVETWAFAFDIAKKKELWRRKLSVEQLEAHSLNDLRDKIADASLALIDDDLIISRTGGAIDLLSASTGEHRATLHQPRWRNSELPSHSGIRWGTSRFQAYPQIRTRSHSLIEIPSDRSLPWLLLPSDGKMLIALDQQNWQIRWSRNVTRETSLLGIIDGTAWILDGGIEQDDHRVSLIGLDPRYGTVRAGPWRLELAARAPEPATHKDEKVAVAPLLRGLPRLFKDTLWIPTLAGIETFSLEDGSSAGISGWPQGTAGGTPLPLSDGRMLLMRRGDTGARTASALELLIPAPQPTSEKQKQHEED